MHTIDRLSTFQGLLADHELAHWRAPIPWRAATALASIWAQIALAVAAYALWPGVLTFLAAFALVAAGQHGLAHASHEFVHGSVIPGELRWNDRLGAWLFAAPILLPFHLYRRRHLLHHRFLGLDADTKEDYRRDLRGRRLAVEIARGLCGATFVARVARVRSRSQADVQARADLLPLALAQAALFALFSFLVGPWLYLALWLLPLVTLYNLLLALRSAVEHQPLRSEAGGARDSGYFMDTPGPFTRSVTAGLAERVVFGRLNFGLHAEHHLWPQLSYQYLPLARRRLEEAGAFSDPCLARERGYLRTLWKLQRGASAG